jgi:hypothetical protein
MGDEFEVWDVVIVAVAVQVADDEAFGMGPWCSSHVTRCKVFLARAVVTIGAPIVCNSVVLDCGIGTAQDVAANSGACDHAPALYVAAGRREGTPAVGAGARDLVVLLPACVAAIDAALAGNWSATGRTCTGIRLASHLRRVPSGSG